MGWVGWVDWDALGGGSGSAQVGTYAGGWGRWVGQQAKQGVCRVSGLGDTGLSGVPGMSPTNY